MYGAIDTIKVDFNDVQNLALRLSQRADGTIDKENLVENFELALRLVLACNNVLDDLGNSKQWERKWRRLFPNKRSKVLDDVSGSDLEESIMNGI